MPDPADWTFVLLSGSTLDELGELAPTGVTFRFERNRGGVIRSMSLPHDAPGASELIANREFGNPILLAYRRDSLHDDNNPVPRFACQLESIEQTLDGDDPPVMQLTWSDPFGVPLNTSTTSAGYSSTAAASIAQNLINNENADHSSRLTVGTVDGGTPSRDREYNLMTVAQAIYELADFGDYWIDIDYLDPRANSGNIAEVGFRTTIGSDLSASVRFAAGPGTDANVVAVSEQEQPIANKVTATVRHAILGTIVAATVTDSVSIAKYGKFELVSEQPDAINDADLTAKATALLRPDRVYNVQFTPDPTLAPQPWEDYWVNDTVGFLCDSYELQIDTTEQVIAIEIDLDENLQETAHRLEYGVKRLTATEQIQGISERVYFLEHGST